MSMEGTADTYAPDVQVICNSWYWISTANGNRFKKCAINYNCPDNCRCGMNTETIEGD